METAQWGHGPPLLSQKGKKIDERQNTQLLKKIETKVKPT